MVTRAQIGEFLAQHGDHVLLVGSAAALAAYDFRLAAGAIATGTLIDVLADQMPEKNSPQALSKIGAKVAGPLVTAVGMGLAIAGTFGDKAPETPAPEPANITIKQEAPELQNTASAPDGTVYHIVVPA